MHRTSPLDPSRLEGRINGKQQPPKAPVGIESNNAPKSVFYNLFIISIVFFFLVIAVAFVNFELMIYALPLFVVEAALVYYVQTFRMEVEKLKNEIKNG